MGGQGVWEDLFQHTSGGACRAHLQTLPPNKRHKTWGGEVTIVGVAGGSDEGDEEGTVGTAKLVLARTTTFNSARWTLAHLVDKNTFAYQYVRELVVVKLGRDHSDIKLLGLPDKLSETAWRYCEGQDREGQNWTQGSAKQGSAS